MRKSLPKTGGKFTPMLATPTFSDFVWDWCARTYGTRRGAEKLLARDARATPHAARGWLRRQHAPQGEHFTELLAVNPDLEREYSAFIAARRSDVDALRAEAQALQARIQTISARLNAQEEAARGASGPGNGGAHAAGNR